MRVFICFVLTLSYLFADPRATIKHPIVAFEARQGEFVSHGASYALSVTPNAAVLTLAQQHVRMSASGARHESSLEGLNLMEGKANYILGRDFRASYDLYGRVRWRGVYPGIDVIFRGNQDHLEYDFEIGAGRNPERIALVFEGADEIRVEPNGDLVLRTGAVTIHQPKPAAWQLIAGRRQPVDAAFRIDGSRRVRFRTGRYDRRHALVIDPEIVFDKTFGGSSQNTAGGFARDAQGALYLAGTTSSTDFVTVNPLQPRLGTASLLVTADAGNTWSFPPLGGARVISRIVSAPSAPLTLYAATPVGIFKSSDGGTSWAAAAETGLIGAPGNLAVDASSATTLYAPTAQGLFISTDGAATFHLLSNGLPGPSLTTIAASPLQSGTVYAAIQNSAAFFRSTDFGQSWTRIPTPADGKVPVITMLFGQNGSLILGTPTGLLLSADSGTTWSAGANQQVYNNQALAISPADANTLYLVNLEGLQRSTDGGLTFSHVLPNVKFTFTAQVAIDPRNPSTVYADDFNLLYRSTDGGGTWSPLSLPYPIVPQATFVSPADSRLFLGAYTQASMFITRWTADGSQIVYSTYLGGSGSDSAGAIAVDATGSPYVTGYTSSPDFPTTSGAFRTKLSGGFDVFVAKLSPDGSKLIYSTLLGSKSSRSNAIAVDSAGNAVIVGSAQGAFPVTPNAFQSAPVAGCNVQIPLEIQVPFGDAFITKIAAGGDSLVYSTLLGGNCATYGNGLALDAKGNAWVSGTTVSTDFPVTSDALQSKPAGGYYDGFLARFSPTGSRDYATYLGGPGYDTLTAIAFDQAGNVYVAGESGGLSQPASTGAFQPQASATCPFFSIGPGIYSLQGNGLVVKLDPAAHSIQRLTYLGAPSCLLPVSIAVDAAGEPWIAGGFVQLATLQTASPLQVTGSGFISKFSADFTQLLFSTYFDYVTGLALDSSGVAYVGGTGAFDTSNGTQPVYVAKIDATPPAISLDSIASVVPAVNPSNTFGIAPGEVIRILGRNIGPATATPGTVVSGVLASTAAGVQVTFDGRPAPLLWVSAQEIDLVTPFELAGRAATTIQVLYNGAKSNAARAAVNVTDIQILGVYNEDGSSNSASNPAKAGTVMSLYMAGVGPTDPPSRDGQINTAPFAAPSMPVQVVWAINNPEGRTEFPITFAGAAPGLAAGIFQVNFVAPQKSALPANLALGSGFGTQFNVYVK